MKKSSERHGFWRRSLQIVTMILSLGVLLYPFTQRLQVVDAKVDLGKEHFPIELPYTQDEHRQKTFFVRTEFKISQNQEVKFRVVPDDCIDRIWLNGNAVDLNQYFEGNLCDFGKGGVLDLTTLVNGESNQNLRFQITNRGGKFGFDLKPLQSDNHIWIHSIAFALAITLVYLSFKGIGIILPIVFFGTFLRLFYLLQTPWSVRTHDVDGHLDYLNLLVKGTLPQLEACWQCYHPPVYYLLTVGLAKIFNAFGIHNLSDAYQIASLGFSLGFFFFCIAIGKRLITGKFGFAFFVSLVAFWPAVLIHSLKIGNDTALYFFSAGAIYFSLAWLQSRNSMALIWVAIFSCLGVLSKSNGILLFGGLALLIIEWISRRIHAQKSFWGGIKPFVNCLVVILIFMGIHFTLIEFRGGWNGLIGNASGLHSKLTVENSLSHLLLPGWDHWWFSPYFDPWGDAKGRQFFLASLVKTGFFGEFNHKGKIAYQLASGVLGIWIILFLWGFIQNVKDFIRRKELLFLGMTLVLSVLAVLSLRLKVPKSCSNDFRYILPWILSFWFLVTGFTKKKKSILTYTYNGLLIVFVILLVLFDFAMLASV